MGEQQNKAYTAGQGLTTDILKSAQRQFKQGPNPYRQSLYTPLSGQTQGLIGTGLGDIAAQRGGIVGDVAAGNWLSGGNPHFEQALALAKGNASTDVNALFNGNGRFGSGAHVNQLGTTLGNMETNARYGQFEDEWGRMTDAQNTLAMGTQAGLGLSGILDADTQAQRMGDFDLWTRIHEAPFQHAQNYMGLASAAGQSPWAQKEVPLWQQLLGYGANIGGGVLSAWAGKPTYPTPTPGA